MGSENKSGWVPGATGLAEINPAGGGQEPWTENLTLQIAAVVALVLAAYWNASRAAFNLDDYIFLSDRFVTGTGWGWGVFGMIRSRPLTYFVVHWNYLANGVDPRGYHWVNILLHLANSIYILLIARRQLSPRASWLAAALFAIHPLQTESVTYIYARATLLCTFFALLSFRFFLREQYWASGAAYGLSLLAKEETVALPVFLLLYDLFQRKRRPKWRYYAGLLVLAELSAAHLFYEAGKRPVPTVGFEVKTVSASTYALTQARVVWKYLRLYLFPVGLTVDHDVGPSWGLLTPPSTLLALLALGLTLGVLAWLTVRGNRPALWALGFFLLLAPSSSIVPISDFMFEHRTYFPLTCLTVATAWLLAQIPRRALVPALPLLLGALLVGTVLRNRVWRDTKTLWTDALKKSPRKARSHICLALAYMGDDPARSRRLVEEGLRFDPNDSGLQSLMGEYLMEQNDAKDAVTHFVRVMALDGESPAGWNSLSAAYFRLGQSDQGVVALRRALELSPCSYLLRGNMMAVLYKLGRKDEARQTGEVPAKCHMVPAEAEELANFRSSLR